MDKRIFITLIAIILLIGTFIGIRTMLNPQCEPPEVSIVPSRSEPGQLVKFTCMNADENVTWSFGDSKSASGKVTDHRFDAAGTYTITVKTDEECSVTVEYIVSAPRTVESIKPRVGIPEEIIARQPVKFKGLTEDATGWKWIVKETGDSGSGPEFTTTFKARGPYTLYVSIDGNYKKGADTIKLTVVNPAPVVIPTPTPKPKPVPVPKPAPKPKPEPKPLPPPAAEFLPNAEFQIEFKKIGNGIASTIAAESDEASDAWASVIQKEVCTTPPTMVELTDQDGVKETIRLDEFKLQLINRQHTIKKAEVMERGVNPRCVKKIKVEVTTHIKKDK